MSAMLWERRKSFRIPVSGKALLHTNGTLDGLYELDDVSIDGCSLHKRADLIARFTTYDATDDAVWSARNRLRNHVRVAIRVEGASEIDMPARVVRRASDGITAQLGLHFAHASPAFEDVIQDLVMDSLENHLDNDDVLVVHGHPERENALFDALRGLGHRIVAARTPRDAVSILEHTAAHIRIALVADVVGTSRARDIAKLILRRFPHVQCVRMSNRGAQRLVDAIKQASARISRRPGTTSLSDRSHAWSLSRLRKVVSATQKHATAS